MPEQIEPSKFREELGDGSDHDQVLYAVKKHFKDCPTYEAAALTVLRIVRSFMDDGRYTDAALILWGSSVFDSRPAVVGLIFDFLSETAKGLIPGSSSLGKSYNSAAWLLLDWIRDPEYTCVKVLSVTATHLKANVMSTLHRLHESAVVPLPGIRLDGFIGMDSKDRYGAIEKVSIKIGENGAGALKGFHPIPRPERHPIFGWYARLRALLDEAEDVPMGVWSSVDNLLSSMEGTENVKIIAPFNPKDITSVVAQKSEPKEGWAKVDPDRHFVWTSKEGWDVLRLDGAQTENVVQQKVLFPNFMTYEGFLNLALSRGGDSPEYWTFARGMYPLKGHVSSVMAVQLFDGAQGSFVFRSFSVSAAGVDLAFEGGDKAILCLGRYGEVSGFRFHGSQEVVHFDEPFWAAQVDQVIELEKMLTLAQAKNLHGWFKEQMVQPEWAMLDKTGNAKGAYDNLCELWSPQVKGVNFGENASMNKITVQDKDLPIEIYDNCGTEMYFAVARWLEYGYLRFGPFVDVAAIQRQFVRRRAFPVGKGPSDKQRIRLEKKPEYKKRYNESPDLADAVSIFLHCVRMNGQEAASALGKRRPEINRELRSFDKMEWLQPETMER